MLFDPNVLYLGSEGANDLRKIVFVDGDLGPHDDTDEIDPSTLDQLWSLDVAGDDFRLRNEAAGETVFLAEDDLSEFRVDTDVRVNGVWQSNGIGTPIVRFPELTDADELHFRHSASDTDEFVVFERHGEADYDLHLFQSGSRQRVHTAGDDDIDAATLDGQGPGHYAELTADETVDGAWTFVGDATFGTLNATTATTGEITADGTLDIDGDVAITGSLSIGGSAVANEAWVEDQLVDVDNSGVSVADNVTLLNFGQDLGVTDDGSGQVTVDYVGAEIPSYVYDDGNEVLSDANGLDFLDDLVVTEGANSIAEISLDLPDDLASTSTDETITGTWTFDTAVDAASFDSGQTYHVDGDRAVHRGEQLWLGEVDDMGLGAVRIRVGGSGHVLEATTTGVDINGVDLTERGDRVATRNWAGTEHDALRDDVAELDADETITGSWAFDTAIDTDGYDIGGDGVARKYSSNVTLGDVDGTDRDLYLRANGNNLFRVFTTGDAEVSNGSFDVDGDLTVGNQIHEAGDRVATRNWAGTELDTLRDDVAELDAQETITANWGFATDTELAFGDGDDYRFRHSATTGDLVLDAMANGADTALRVYGDGTLGPIEADSLAAPTVTVGGEAAATESYVDGSVFSGSYSDLSNVPSTFTPETHDNSSHSQNYASESYIDNQLDPLESTQITSSGDFHVWFPNTETEFWLHDGGDVEADGAFVGSYIDTENGGQFGGGVTVDGNLDVNGSIETDGPITIDDTFDTLYAVVGDEEIEVQINGSDGSGILNIKTN